MVAILDFFKGVNGWVWFKIGNFSFVLFLDILGLEIMSDDKLVKKKKQAVLEDTNNPF